MRRVARLVLIAPLLAACAPAAADAFTVSFATGERALNAGRYDDAARAFDDAATKARRVKDRDEARFLEARAYARVGRFPEEQAAYRKLVADSPTGPRTVRAEFEIAEIEIDHGDAEKGWAMLLDTAHRHPDGLARPAIYRLMRREQESAGGDAAALAWLEKNAPAFSKTELDQVFAYEIARTQERMGQKAIAREGFVATARAHPYPFGGLTDDALFHAAEIDVELGRPEQAIQDLRELVAPREGSDTIGSYQRPLFSKAALRIGEIYRDALKDHRSARREFHRLYTDFPTSILRDDAIWAEARLARDDGDTGETCSLATILVERLSDSRYAPCARALCSSAPAAHSKDKAPPRECPEYILRDLASPSDAPRAASDD